MHQVGLGFLGPVFRTYGPDVDCLVAVKAFQLDLTPEQLDIFVDALKQIVEVGLSHSGIISPISAGLEGGIPFIAQEYIATESLDVVMRQHGPLQPQRILSFVSQLARAIDGAHALGVVHGAIHLRDVFVATDGARTNGFGIASALEHVGVRVPVRRPYSAPEIITGRRWGPEADRFSVAAIAYELLTGKRVAGTSDEILACLVKCETADVADPAGLQQVFRNALADDPEIRPLSATGFVASLGDAIGVSTTDEKPRMALIDVSLNETSDEWVDGNVKDDSEGKLKSLDSSLEAHLPIFVKSNDDSIVPLEPEPSQAVVTQSTTVRPKKRVGHDFDKRVQRLPLEPDDHHSTRLTAASTSEAARLEAKAPQTTRGNAIVGQNEVAGEISTGVNLPALDYDDGQPVMLSRTEQYDAAIQLDKQANPFPSSKSFRARLAAVLAVAIGISLAYVASVGLDTVRNENANESSNDVADSGGGVDLDLPTSPQILNLESVEVVEEIDESQDLFREASEASSVFRTFGAITTVDPSPATAGSSTAAAPTESTVGWLLVRTYPPTAIVSVDGQVRGQAPLSITDIPHGTYRLEVSADGYTTDDRDVTISSDQTVASVSVTLVPVVDTVAILPNVGLSLPSGVPTFRGPPGSLYVDSRPPGAVVRVDGVQMGVTPLLLPDITSGVHRVRIEGVGYRPWITSVTVRSEQRVRVTASLEAGGGRR